MPELSLAAYRRLVEIVHQATGIVLGDDKSYLLRHRLDPLIRSQNLLDYNALVAGLNGRNGAALRTAIIDAITTKETQFFRDAACYKGLLEHVLPALVRGRAAHGDRLIRIWSAATATGQEAYSLAMLAHEFCAIPANMAEETHFSILATDISTAAIATATAGTFTAADVHRGLSAARLALYFHHRSNAWHVKETVRRLVQFRTFNLLQPPGELAGTAAFDLILCRNVLFYFDSPTRRKICAALYAALRPGGWLVLGAAESLYGIDHRLETIIHDKMIFYRKSLTSPFPQKVDDAALLQHHETRTSKDPS